MSYIRVSLRGRLGSQEVWSCNPAYNETTNVVGWEQVDGQNAANAIGALAVPGALRDIASASGPGISVRVERRSDSHELIGAAEAPWTGWGTSTRPADKPAQSSVVLSLRSNVPGGRARGRLYWPGLSVSIDQTTMRLQASTTQALANAASAYLDSIETKLKEQLAPSPSLLDYHLCVVSKTGGFRTDVNKIMVGDVLDVQRRRRDRMPEAYSTVAYP